MDDESLKKLHMGGHVCPVCGYSGLLMPPRHFNGDGSSEICNCCSFEYGVTDNDEGWTYAKWREKWIADGMRWQWGRQEPPAWWDPENQLRRVALPSVKPQ